MDFVYTSIGIGIASCVGFALARTWPTFLVATVLSVAAFAALWQFGHPPYSCEDAADAMSRQACENREAKGGVFVSLVIGIPGILAGFFGIFRLVKLLHR